MARREQVNCEICNSFLHTTKQHNSPSFWINELEKQEAKKDD